MRLNYVSVSREQSCWEEGIAGPVFIISVDAEGNKNEHVLPSFRCRIAACNKPLSQQKIGLVTVEKAQV